MAAKIFQFDNEKVSRKNRAEPMDAEAWFRAQQPMLLWMANKSKDGRKLLRLDQTNLDRVDRIAMNHVGQDKYVRDGGTLFRPKYTRVSTTDFRVGAKWANLINYQWDWFAELAREYYAKMDEERVVHVGHFIPVVKWRSRLEGMLVPAGTTTTVYPDPNPETTSVDGKVQAQLRDISWATLIALTDADAAQDSSADVESVMFMRASATLNQWAALSRSFFLFDTSSIADGDTVSAATLSVDGGDGVTTKTDGLTATPNLNIYASTPASSTALVTDDFDQIGSTAFATAITYASWSDTAYNDFALNASGLANISKTGVSKFGAKNANYDAAASPPTWIIDALSALRCYFAEVSGTTQDPKLVVTHAAAASFIPSIIIM